MISFSPISPKLLIIVTERGQGMNHGVADAHVLVKELTKANVGGQTFQKAV
jgi:2-polyprenyl-6-methoxyphenol hydroxylase-like FAD-dependent oxidoreductase